MKPMVEFESVISFTGGKPDEAEVLEALFQAGLDDTIVGTGRPDVNALSFTRSGPNLEQVLTAAVAQIMGECLILCVSDLAHAVFRYVQASKRPAKSMAS
jgi:hypothetical protein